MLTNKDIECLIRKLDTLVTRKDVECFLWQFVEDFMEVMFVQEFGLVVIHGHGQVTKRLVYCS